MEATDCALNLEHIIFKDSKQSNIYRGKIFSKVAEINKATKSKELHYVLTSKSGNVTQSAKEESNSSDVGVSAVNVPQFKAPRFSRINPPATMGFQTASSLLLSKEQSVSPKDTDSDNNTSSDTKYPVTFQTARSLLVDGASTGVQKKKVSFLKDTETFKFSYYSDASADSDSVPESAVSKNVEVCNDDTDSADRTKASDSFTCCYGDRLTCVCGNSYCKQGQ
uniref:Uncharacterized protein LOC102810202 n=1 Tax=Saccoglossus kowalevskii TaxID=10224 RepID=A0ABM0M6S1_SACKO|nr:PREDICTED: uncharacterized protein LOC102810202 [Saccoglossus kowalevskii]